MLPELAQTLQKQLGLDDFSVAAQALQALTALSKGEGQLLFAEGKNFVTVIASKIGNWEERLIGRLVPMTDEPFALRALKRKKVCFAPKGLLRGSEPVAHCAAFLSSFRLVMTLDIPLAENIRLSPLQFLLFPKSLLRKIAFSAWCKQVPACLLPWSLLGQAGVFVWDEKMSLRWGIGEPPKIEGFQKGSTLKDEIAVLKTDVGTVARLIESRPQILRGYALIRSEVHHRVKNDLQSIVSWLMLQARNSSEEARKVLLDAAERIRVFATVHDLLARSKGDFVELRELAQRLANWAVERAKSEGKDVRFVVVGPEVNLTPKQGSTIAAIINELVWNACKHAFDSETGVITVRWERSGNELSLEVSDNGKGFEFEKLNNSTLGLTIVRNLVEQDLNGKVEIRSSIGEGTRVSLKFAINQSV
ncbi:MAG: sensor histidine kinase [Armatimonadetes bacterium]|nr:sensor histidine kinase [Armatimonadota bacterium]MDW8029854.1 sensor histidine kinase [Armatimonadota bacterium]